VDVHKTEEAYEIYEVTMRLNTFLSRRKNEIIPKGIELISLFDQQGEIFIIDDFRKEIINAR
jgi:hypothetical protein